MYARTGVGGQHAQLEDARGDGQEGGERREFKLVVQRLQAGDDLRATVQKRVGIRVSASREEPSGEGAITSRPSSEPAPNSRSQAASDGVHPAASFSAHAATDVAAREATSANAVSREKALPGVDSAIHAT